MEEPFSYEPFDRNYCSDPLREYQEMRFTENAYTPAPDRNEVRLQSLNGYRLEEKLREKDAAYQSARDDADYYKCLSEAGQAATVFSKTIDVLTFTLGSAVLWTTGNSVADYVLLGLAPWLGPPTIIGLVVISATMTITVWSFEKAIQSEQALRCTKPPGRSLRLY